MLKGERFAAQRQMDLSHCLKWWWLLQVELEKWLGQDAAGGRVLSLGRAGAFIGQ